MKEKENVLLKVNRKSGFKTPEGYFERLYDRLPGELPERKEPATLPMTRWQKLKPYVYLAAMFAGIWCMVKMVHMISSSEQISLDNSPQEMVAMLDEEPETFEEMYSSEYAAEDFELESEVLDEFGSFEQLEKHLNIELEPEYAQMKVKMPAAIESAATGAPEVAQNTPTTTEKKN